MWPLTASFTAAFDCCSAVPSQDSIASTMRHVLFTRVAEAAFVDAGVGEKQVELIGDDFRDP